MFTCCNYLPLHFMHIKSSWSIIGRRKVYMWYQSDTTFTCCNYLPLHFMHIKSSWSIIGQRKVYMWYQSDTTFMCCNYLPLHFMHIKSSWSIIRRRKVYMSYQSERIFLITDIYSVIILLSISLYFPIFQEGWNVGQNIRGLWVLHWVQKNVSWTSWIKNSAPAPDLTNVQ